MGVLTLEQMELRRLKQENRDLKRYLRNIATVVADSIAALDAEMKRPSTHERGQRIAAVSNVLEHANDSLMAFGLKIDYRQISKVKKRWLKNPPTSPESRREMYADA